MKLIKTITILISSLLILAPFSSIVKCVSLQGGSVCDVASYSKAPFHGKGDKATQMGDLSKMIALGTNKSVRKTTYSYHVHIDGQNGIYYSDCSCFVGFVVHQISPAHFTEIPRDDCVKPPAARANMWSGFFSEGPASKGASKLWKGIKKVHEAKHGDVLSWGFVVDKKTCKILGGHNDTGHVMFIVNGPNGENPVKIEKNWAIVWVADASNIRHLPGSDNGARYSKLSIFNEKNPGKTAGGPKNTGVGMGQIKIGIKSNGEPDGKFILQKKEVDGAQIGIGRPL